VTGDKVGNCGEDIAVAGEGAEVQPSTCRFKSGWPVPSAARQPRLLSRQINGTAGSLGARFTWGLSPISMTSRLIGLATIELGFTVDDGCGGYFPAPGFLLVQALKAPVRRCVLGSAS
jgi:hypothetical protein